METKHSETKWAYKIEPKLDGSGFVAKPNDPSQESIEGATREEVEEKLRAKLMEMVGAQVKAGLGGLGFLNIPGVTVKVNRRVNVTSKKDVVRDVASNLGFLTSKSTSETAPPPIEPTTYEPTNWKLIAAVLGVALLLTLAYFLRR